MKRAMTALMMIGMFLVVSGGKAVSADDSERVMMSKEVVEAEKALVEERADQGLDTLEAVIIKAVREQAAGKNFKFEPEQEKVKEKEAEK